MANVKKARMLRMLFCDFCGRSHEVCAILIQGRDEVHICDECVDQCVTMLVEDREKSQPSISAPTPVTVEPAQQKVDGGG